MKKRIKWFKLKNKDHMQAFKERMLRDMDMEMGDVNGWWNRVSESILRAGKEVLVGSSGKIWENKETWWFNAEVQQNAQATKMARKRLEVTRLDGDKEYYNSAARKKKNGSNC